MNKQRKLGIFFGILGVVLMSIESPLIKLASLYWADVSFILGISLILSINTLLLSRGKKFFIKNYKIAYKGVIISGLCAGLSNLSFVSAVIYGGVANTVLILATAPVFSAIFMWILFKKPTPKSIFLATFFIFVGLYVILKDELGDGTFLGVLLAFLCVTFMISIYISLSYFKRSSKLAYVSVAGFVLCFTSLPFVSLHVNLNSFLTIFFIGFLTMPLSRYLLGMGSKYVFPQEMSLILILESVLAPLWAWWWLGDKPPLNTFIGGGIILGSLILYILSTNKKSITVKQD